MTRRCPPIDPVALAAATLVVGSFTLIPAMLLVEGAGAVFMTLVNYQVPLWSMLFGAWILNEVLPLRFFAALAIILCGLAVSQQASLRKIFRS